MDVSEPSHVGHLNHSLLRLSPTPNTLAWNIVPTLLLGSAVACPLVGQDLPLYGASRFAVADGFVHLRLGGFHTRDCLSRVRLSVALFSARIAQHMVLAPVAVPLLALSPPVYGRRPYALTSAAAFLMALWAWHVPILMRRHSATTSYAGACMSRSLDRRSRSGRHCSTRASTPALLSLSAPQPACKRQVWGPFSTSRLVLSSGCTRAPPRHGVFLSWKTSNSMASSCGFPVVRSSPLLADLVRIVPSAGRAESGLGTANS